MQMVINIIFYIALNRDRRYVVKTNVHNHNRRGCHKVELLTLPHLELLT